MITFEDIQNASKQISTMEISRTDKKTGKTTTKDYAEVNQRVKAFRMLYPEGSILTDMLSDDGERCVFKATILNAEGKTIATGTAFELKSSSFINASSYIENCETSAIGRALAMCGLGIDLSIASYEEVANAMKNQNKDDDMKLPLMNEPKTNSKQAAPKVEEQEKKAEEAQGYPERKVMLEFVKKKYPNGSKNLESLLKCWQIDDIEKASTAQLMVVWSKYTNGANR